MRYVSAKDWAQAPEKRLMLFGMSGLGKTHVSNILRDTGGWFHYSVDYRIGTRYMGEHIADGFKAEAMQVPALERLLKSDSIYIASNITFDNLAPLSDYLGKPGDPAKGGLPIAEYKRRQALHFAAEQAAMLDTNHFIDRAQRLYGYKHFVCDTSGSICEVVDPTDPGDPILTAVAEDMLPVWIQGTDAHTAELVRRFDKAPKPMCYLPAFLDAAWDEYLQEKALFEDQVDPDAFVRWTFARALAHRQPRYRAMADNWGVTISASDVAKVRSADDMTALVGHALEARG